MSDWRPISAEEFAALFEAQLCELNQSQGERFERVRVPLERATLRRSEMYGDERVFVVARTGDCVLYFDDMEYGFNISTIDASGRVLTPGGSQNTLGEAIDQWMG